MAKKTKSNPLMIAIAEKVGTAVGVIVSKTSDAVEGAGKLVGTAKAVIPAKSAAAPRRKAAARRTVAAVKKTVRKKVVKKTVATIKRKRPTKRAAK